MNFSEKILALREGGQVQRAHTIPHFGEYNVATHSYNALSLLLMLSPVKPSLNLVQAVLWHDVPERWTGDVPAPAKWASPVLKATLDQMEERILEKLGLNKIFAELTTVEQDWLTSVDLLELYIWTHEQVAYGNSNMIDMQKRIENVFEKRADKTPKLVREFIKEFSFKRNIECDELFWEK